MNDKFVCPECGKELDEVNVVTECSRPMKIDKNGAGIEYEVVDWYGSDTIRVDCPHCFCEITGSITE